MGATWYFLSWLGWNKSKQDHAVAGALKKRGSELSFLTADDNVGPPGDVDETGGGPGVSAPPEQNEELVPEITPLPWSVHLLFSSFCSNTLTIKCLMWRVMLIRVMKELLFSNRIFYDQIS
jgi:hypothetical protein